MSNSSTNYHFSLPQASGAGGLIIPGQQVLVGGMVKNENATRGGGGPPNINSLSNDVRVSSTMPTTDCWCNLDISKTHTFSFSMTKEGEQPDKQTTAGEACWKKI